MLESGLDESACVVPLDTPPLTLSPDCNQEMPEGTIEAEGVRNGRLALWGGAQTFGLKSILLSTNARLF